MRDQYGTWMLIGAFVAAGSCVGGDGSSAGNSGAGPVVWDSAGVRVVENGAAPTARWTVTPEPSFRIGWDEDGPLFTWVQSGRILPDGGALLAEQSTGTVYRLDASGVVVDSLGGRGQGPGEFERMDGIVLHADSIVVSDNRQARVTVIAPDGGVRTARLPGGSILPELSAVAPDGRMLMVQGDAYGGPPRGGETGWVFNEEPILAVSPDGARADTLAILAHVRLWYDARAGTPGPIWVKGRAGGYDDGFAWARSDQTAVRWYDWEGRLVQIARWMESPTEVDAELRRRIVDQYRAAWADNGWDAPRTNRQLEELEDGLERFDLPLPYWDQLHVDRLGNVWLSRYPPPFTRSEAWQIVERNGRHAGEVVVPGSIRILDATEDRVLAVVMNELDVPAVVMHEIVKR